MEHADLVEKEFCHERHTWINRELGTILTTVGNIQKAQDEYNRTIKNIYYSLMVIAASTILTLAGVIVGRIVEFRFPF